MPSESQPYHTKRIHLRYAQKDGIIETSQVNSFYRRICEAAGIEYNGQHALRHTFATRSIEAGVPPLVLKKWLGHANIHITLDTYSDVFDKMNFESTDKLDLLMGSLMPE
jgi:integrase